MKGKVKKLRKGVVVRVSKMMVIKWAKFGWGRCSWANVSMTQRIMGKTRNERRMDRERGHPTDGQMDGVQKVGGGGERKGNRAGSRHRTLGSSPVTVLGPRLPEGQRGGNHKRQERAGRQGLSYRPGGGRCRALARGRGLSGRTSGVSSGWKTNH